MVRDRSNLLSATNRTTDVKKTRYPEGTHIPVNFRNTFSSRINDPVVHMCRSQFYIYIVQERGLLCSKINIRIYIRIIYYSPILNYFLLELNKKYFKKC